MKQLNFQSSSVKMRYGFRGKAIAEILGCSNPLKAISMHIDSEDKREISELGSNSRGTQNGPLQERNGPPKLQGFQNGTPNQ